MHKSSIVSLLLFAILVPLMGCKTTTNSTEMKPTDSIHALQQFDQRQFSDWHGLSPECTASDVANYAGGDLSQSGTHWLGEKKLAASFVSLAFQGYEDPVKLWFRGDQVVSLEAEYPQLDDAKALLASLGKPDATLDFYFDIMLNQGGEYVFCEKGITLFMDSQREDAVKISVYPPMNLDDYKANLYYLEPPREFLDHEE